ncbi:MULTISPECIES: hypothetical protein [unclassified Brevundimonas]|uniref:hypothetical protein n=1 Tax=unclassified Brevundimonas TaxID=2622653 RepID=UPI000CFCDA1B|nr:MULTISPECIES: hypothetical protein [unclassified Brevundimonas]PRA33572.1 hypothetical protein CQ024_04225 [Brevundimonas sp. MYb27]PQZ81788.1 hypothetical protein CQ026_08700 [Brevundimonas sp. MYb31]PRB13361.1 hypothetical protein CQ039_12805 [Brevundimonas sp. MYb52]PRB34010.1 hypothetical protein CQ035_11820 [Brevundimonas sp. MYb46]PRB52698.1 hypothetical protein CQ028_05925 [Brevundimonas sp. MYb33]
MRARAAPPPPDLDPARREGDTVGVLAGDALRVAADFLDSIESDDADARKTLTDEAGVCRKMAEAVALAPLRNSSRVLAPTDLDGRFFTLTERMWPNAVVASYLLGHTADLMEALPAADGELKNRLLLYAQRLQRVRTLLDLAPNAQLGPRLTELMPLLRELVRPVEGETPFPPLLIDGVTADPIFHAAAQDAYRIVVGRELDDLPAMASAVWSGKLALAWLRVREKGWPLTAVEAAQLAEAVRSPRKPWSRAPAVPGDWIDLDPEAAGEVLRLISAHHRVGSARAPFPLAGFCDRVRALALRCHGGVMLIETQGRVSGGATGIAAFVLTEDKVLAVDGTSAWIHNLNDAVGPHLQDEGARLDYIRLFMNCVRHDGERFQPTESFEDLADRATDIDLLRDLCVGHARVIEPAGFDAEGRWLFLLVVCHRQGFFAIGLALAPNGVVEMIDDTLLADGVPVRSERMDGLFVILEPKEAIS